MINTLNHDCGARSVLTRIPGRSHPAESAISKVLASLMVTLMPAAVMATAFSDKQEENVIRVHVEGLRSDRGQVRCALFASGSDFPKRTERALASATAKITAGHATCEFPTPPPGTYAVSAFHDENSNGKLDTHPLGIPREGVGASNNPKPRMGPPKFSAAQFHHSGEATDITINIHYL